MTCSAQLSVCPRPVDPRFKDLTGTRFARLLVTDYAGRVGPKGSHAFHCKCDCGIELITRSYCLTGGMTRSCGCLLADKNKEIRTTHGLAGTREWRIWAGMKNRCGNPNVKSYERYGGAGVRVCERWLTGDGIRGGFECFYEDMGRRPSPKHSLDRIDPFGNYEPSNVRWATPKEQEANKRNNVKVAWRGQSLRPADWEPITGIAASEICKRIKRGWSIERALTQPMRRRLCTTV